MAVAVRLLGNVSVTVTVPLVGPVPELLAVMVYVAAVCPCVKFPVWVLLMVRSGVRAGLIVRSEERRVGKELTSRPSATVAVLSTDAAALLGTFTVSVRTG